MIQSSSLMHDSAYSGVVAAMELLRGVQDEKVFAKRLYEVMFATLEIYEHYVVTEGKRIYPLNITASEN